VVARVAMGFAGGSGRARRSTEATVGGAMHGGKNFGAAGCKPECLQPLTKRRIDPTRSSNNTTKTLPDGPAGGVYPSFCERGCKHSGLQPAAPNFFPAWTGWRREKERSCVIEY
jgi:hypothetical protein